MKIRCRSLAAAVAVTVAAGLGTLVSAGPALAQGAAPGAPGANATWNEANLQGFADSLGSDSKVWYTLGDGELENVFYPETDTPDTFGLQYIVTNGSSFADTETADTTHAISLVDPTSLVWQQVNTATNGDFTITKTYIADPSRSVVLIETTFDNLTSTPLQLYADYLPQLNNDGMGNTGGTDATSGDLVASNGSVSSALSSSAGFAQTTTGYVGSSSDGSEQLAGSYGLTSTYSSASTAGHIVQVAQIPVAASGSTTFTLALAFDSSQSAAISDAAASLAAGFSPLESSFEAGWHSWLGRPERAARLRHRQRQARRAVLRLADGAQGRRGQDVRRRVHRIADRSLGHQRERQQRGRPRVPRGMDPRRVRNGIGPACGR